MLYAEARELILARVSEFTTTFPTTAHLIYRRISTRQQQLYLQAAQVNPEWAGTWADAAPDAAGRIDLADLTDPLEAIGRVFHMEVLDPGSSSYPVGQTIHVVRRADPDVAEAPRVYVVDRIIEPHRGEMDGVAKVRVHYTRIPLARETGDAEIELPAPHDELLVLDGAIQLLKRTLQIEPAVKQAALEVLAEEEKDALETFMAYVAGYVAGVEARFAGARYA